jgi:hypothetical protein
MAMVWKPRQRGNWRCPTTRLPHGTSQAQPQDVQRVTDSCARVHLFIRPAHVSTSRECIYDAIGICMMNSPESCVKALVWYCGPTRVAFGSSFKCDVFGPGRVGGAAGNRPRRPCRDARER